MLRSFQRQIGYTFALAMLLTLPGSARALTIDFELDSGGAAIVAGQTIDDEYLADGVMISGINLNHNFDIAAAFDSDLSGTMDLDLEFMGGWAGGNIAGEALGNMLIINANDLGIPDDEGARAAGQLIFDLLDFDSTSIGFDLVDLDDSEEAMGSVELFLDNVLVGSFDFEDLTDSSSSVFDGTIVFGDRTANRISPIDVSSFGIDSAFDRVVFNMGGSGAVDNVAFERTEVPAPAAAVVLLLGLGAAALRRRLR